MLRRKSPKTVIWGQGVRMGHMWQQLCPVVGGLVALVSRQTCPVVSTLYRVNPLTWAQIRHVALVSGTFAHFRRQICPRLYSVGGLTGGNVQLHTLCPDLTFSSQSGQPLIAGHLGQVSQHTYPSCPTLPTFCLEQSMLRLKRASPRASRGGRPGPMTPPPPPTGARSANATGFARSSAPAVATLRSRADLS